MTILTEAERVAALKYYDSGWSFPEIEAELIAQRSKKLRREMRPEIIYVIGDRFSLAENEIPPGGEVVNEKCAALKWIKDKKLARGDIEEDGKIWRLERRK